LTITFARAANSTAAREFLAKRNTCDVYCTQALAQGCRMSTPATHTGPLQKPALTPQLQQAFRLLQLPAPALQSHLQSALEGNVMLEADEEFDSTWALDAAPDFAVGEIEWLSERASTLQDHLAWQLGQAPLPNGPRAIARALIGAIDADGYLVESPQAIAATVSKAVRADAAVVESVLAIVQQFDPAGVGARSFCECIGLQLEHLEPGTPALDVAKKIARNHLQLADNHQFVDLQRLCGCSGTDVETALALIRGCDRRPGAAFQQQPVTFIVPDVFARHGSDGWSVELNAVAAPRLRVNERYAAMLTGSADHALLRVQLQEARWLVGALETRNETVLGLARAIVYRQKAFLGHGAESMRAVPPAEIGEAVELPESAIPRATAGKYLHTPRGVFEFRFLLSSPLPRADGVAA
jgi:RNA polymerase sigma-54 factor